MLCIPCKCGNSWESLRHFSYNCIAERRTKRNCHWNANELQDPWKLQLYRASRNDHEINYQRPPKGAGRMVPRENGRKVSKTFLTLFDDFWRLLPCAKTVEKCRKTFWHFLTIFDVFWRVPFPPAPFAIRWNENIAHVMLPICKSFEIILKWIYVMQSTGPESKMARWMLAAENKLCNARPIM